MQYISEEEFRKQPIEVQKVFIDWWRPSMGDLYTYSYEEDSASINCCNSKTQIEQTNRWKGLEIGQRTPLFTEGQLREFIEKKTNCKINVAYEDAEIIIRLDDLKSYEFKRIFNNLDNDLLQALWQVALKIAKENIH